MGKSNFMIPVSGKADTIQDGDFQTLRHLIGAGALGTIKEAELHYDFESGSAWFPMIPEKYRPGAGITFGLGEEP